MALDKQINIYSVDTSAFFTKEEKKIEIDRLGALRRKNLLKKENTIIFKFLSKHMSEKSAIYKIRKEFKNKEYLPELTQDHIDENFGEIKSLTKFINQKKKELLDLLPQFQGIRKLNPEHLKDKNVVSVFESSLTRTLNMQVDSLYNDIIIVQTYYYDVIEDIVVNGFLNGKVKYKCLTASAGQIRTKKIVFIKENIWKLSEYTLMCALTLDRINSAGGVNVNKYLAYLALCNSATDLWEDFDIDRCVVVDDMKTIVNGIVDYINPKTYKITRTKMDVPINHMDGCGMILPKKSKRNFMLRMPWVKGLLAVFDFVKFIKEFNCNSKIVDIYGDTYDIIDDDIQIILTKSQFKMAKYYKNWEEYKTLFKIHNCTAGKCNIEPSQFDNAKLNYQMLQTLSDITDDELRAISNESFENIRLLVSNRKTMLRVFKATQYNQNKNAFQEALMIYPELLQDSYSKETLSDIKASLQKDLWSAKFDVNGFYTFIVPDLFAFSQWLFLDAKNPVGLLKDGEVSCKLFPNSKKLDCLRSPHLFIEHGVRNNVFSEDILKWFTTKAIYVSVHDLISKLLQFDVDGDKSLVCADETIISVAERNIKNHNVVPLYYEMGKAGCQIIDSKKIYEGLNSAYKGGRIGEISNLITKIWNSDDIDIDLIKQLCLQNNFEIDFAKTLYKPEVPPEIKAKISHYGRIKTPSFFQYAKKKTEVQVEAANTSCVNRLRHLLPNQRLQFNAQQLGKLNYKMLMNNPKTDITSELAESLIKSFFILSKKIGKEICSKEDGSNNFSYIYGQIKQEMNKICSDDILITDILVKQLFYIKKSKRKAMFWNCYGDIVVKNLKRNLAGTVMCEECGKRTAKTNNSVKYCDSCAYKQNIAKTVKRRKIKRQVFETENHSKPAS